VLALGFCRVPPEEAFLKFINPGDLFLELLPHVHFVEVNLVHELHELFNQILLAKVAALTMNVLRPPLVRMARCISLL